MDKSASRVFSEYKASKVSIASLAWRLIFEGTAREGIIDPCVYRAQLASSISLDGECCRARRINEFSWRPLGEVQRAAALRSGGGVSLLAAMGSAATYLAYLDPLAHRFEPKLFPSDYCSTNQPSPWLGCHFSSAFPK